MEPSVAILMGSDSDLATMKAAADVLGELGVPCQTRILSAHRTPERTLEFVRAAPGRGVRVFIAGAGGAAHLAGTIAAHTTLPVIGVPLAPAGAGVGGGLGGIDALLSTVQMPPGVPVATVAIGGAANAALLAAAILALSDEALAERLRRRRADQARRVEEKDRALG